MPNITIMRSIPLSKIFLTGCDSNQEWLIPWFLSHIRKYTSLPIFFCNFGDVSQQSIDLFDGTVSLSHSASHWFYKPQALMNSSADKTVWIDLDCQVKGSIDEIFSYIEPNRLAMAVDQPWSKRMNTIWHNSGIVGISRPHPPILTRWEQACRDNPIRGDQETLHFLMTSELDKRIHISDIPNKYNVLRLQIDDGSVPSDVRVMHWTGTRGKDEIRRQMNEL